MFQGWELALLDEESYNGDGREPLYGPYWESPTCRRVYINPDIFYRVSRRSGLTPACEFSLSA
ncbi:MAG: hypothetical protein IJ617_02865 [Oscillospiraceae bacterium]|nr:hypothetical protein [Oscillospiraceae bacterium]